MGDESTASVFRGLLARLQDRGNKVGSSKAQIIYRKKKKSSASGARGISKWCTMHSEGQTRNSRFPLNPKTRWGPSFLRLKQKESGGAPKAEQGLKRQKRPRAYLKTVGWVCFEDLSTLPDGEIRGWKRRPGEGVWQRKAKNVLKTKPWVIRGVQFKTSSHQSESKTCSQWNGHRIAGRGLS